MEKRKRLLSRGLLWAFCIFAIYAVIYNFWNDSHRQNLLQDSIKAKAILIERIKGTGIRSSSNGTFLYVVDGREFEFTERNNFNDLELGDTVLIEYSRSDPTVARVVEKHFMVKYR